MTDLPIKKLTALTKHFGKDLLDDYARCDELLSDFCGEYRLEVSLLVSAIRAGCAKELLEGAVDGVVADELYIRLVCQLQKNAGIMPEYAEWGIKGVATALEFAVNASKLIQLPMADTFSLRGEEIEFLQLLLKGISTRAEARAMLKKAFSEKYPDLIFRPTSKDFIQSMPAEYRSYDRLRNNSLILALSE